MRAELKSFIKFVDFLADMLGQNSEVVLHDLTDVNNSIIAIRNGHISGRTVGGPATDLTLKILKNPQYRKQGFLCNYKGYAKNGDTIKSSSFFIYDTDEKIIGMLCVNTDCEKLIRAKEFLDSLLCFHERENNQETEEITEKLDLSVEELVLDSVQKVVFDIGVGPERLSQQEKIEIVKQLYEQGVFLLKGAVGQIAAILKMSEPSIYRYLNQIKRAEEIRVGAND